MSGALRCLILRVLSVCLCFLSAVLTRGDEPEALLDGGGRWTLERARAWSGEQPWFVGCNYMPSSAINQLEMFQAETFAWAREAQPLQPLTSGVWRDSENIRQLDECKRIQLSNSDVISFHTYGDAASLERCLTNLGRYGRPLLCMEFMARPNGSVFDPHLQVMRDSKCGAWCWGFINGRSQTIYPWDSWTKSYLGPPPVWFHDVLQPDGTPFRQSEVDYIRRVTGVLGR